MNEWTTQRNYPSLKIIDETSPLDSELKLEYNNEFLYIEITMRHSAGLIKLDAGKLRQLRDFLNTL